MLIIIRLIILSSYFLRFVIKNIYSLFYFLMRDFILLTQQIGSPKTVLVTSMFLVYLCNFFGTNIITSILSIPIHITIE